MPEREERDGRRAQGDDAWTLRFAGNRLDLRLIGGRLETVYLGPDFAGEANVEPDHHQNADQLRATRPEAAVYLGPNRDRVHWRAATGSADGEGLHLVLSAEDLRAEVDFRVDAETASLLRRTRLVATGAHEVEITGALSFSLRVAEPVRQATYLTGRWAHETQVRRIVPDHTPLLLESRSGKTGFEYQPYLCLETATGTVLVELLWSGNWQIAARTREDDCLVSGGLPDAGFRHVLAPGESLDLPEALVVRVAGDVEVATQKLHAARRRLQAGDVPYVPVQFNSWYPYPGDPPAGDLKRLADTALALGCEVLVLDGGWHVNESDPIRDDPWQSTGDWKTNPRLFPNGLEELSDHCHRIGIGFGIWFEPESIGYSSALRTRHPEWHHWIDGLPPDPARRAVLHLGVPAAREHVRDTMLEIIGRTGARWVKWDFNADLVSGGWAAETPAALARRDPVLAHYEGLYRLQEELRAAMPELILEMCASGGGRFDGRILRQAHVNWMSDQANPLKNLAIHFGAQRAHPARFCNDWLIAWPAADFVRHGGSEPDLRGDLRFRLLVPMLGSFGLSSRLDRWSAGDIETTRRHIGWYKATARPLVEAGRQFMLTEPPPLGGEGDWAAMWYAAADGSAGVGYFFRLAGEDARRTFALPGLDAEADYIVGGPEAEPRRMSGRALGDGYAVELPERFRAAAISVQRAA
jgi:alpha-galactosidase